ncbi:hypothetical protein ACVW0P_003632 [Mucilaginibacter sp. UYNi724]
MLTFVALLAFNSGKDTTIFQIYKKNPNYILPNLQFTKGKINHTYKLQRDTEYNFVN